MAYAHVTAIRKLEKLKRYIALATSGEEMNPYQYSLNISDGSPHLFKGRVVHLHTHNIVDDHNIIASSWKLADLYEAFIYEHSKSSEVPPKVEYVSFDKAGLNMFAIFQGRDFSYFIDSKKFFDGRVGNRFFAYVDNIYRIPDSILVHEPIIKEGDNVITYSLDETSSAGKSMPIDDVLRLSHNFEENKLPINSLENMLLQEVPGFISTEEFNKFVDAKWQSGDFNPVGFRDKPKTKFKG